MRKYERQVRAIPMMAGLVLIACTSAPAVRPAPFNQQWLVPPDILQRWHEDKAALEPGFAGSAGWRRQMEFVERELRNRRVAALERDPVPYQRWFTTEDGRDWSLTVDGRPVNVASYWAYSGSTPEEGISAPLVYYDARNPPDIAGRIVVFDVPPLPVPLPPMFQPSQVFATADLGEPGIGASQWYQSNYPTRFGKFDGIVRNGKAAGALVIFDAGPGRVRGLYTFPLLSAELVGAPGLYLDRVAGASVREAARAGRPATLRLIAHTETAEPWFLSGILPGRHFGTDQDELVLLVTHSDGPNLTQENGPLAILAVVDYFAKLPRSERARSLLIVIDPQHYMPGRHRVDWFKEHAEVAARIVASIGVEQFGQREYDERGEIFRQTGRADTTIIFAQDDPVLIDAAVAAINQESLPRTVVRVPSRGQGSWAGLGDIAIRRKIAGYGTSTDMSAYWSTAPGIESFDSELAYRQIAVVTRLTDVLMHSRSIPLR